MARLSGELVHWDDDRGFGFIVSDEGRKYFVHISAIGRIATRPHLGDRVSFDAGRSRDGRPAALAVSIAGANPVDAAALRRGLPQSRERAQARDYFRVGGAFLLLVLLLVAIVLDRAPLWLLGLYIAVGLLSAFTYLIDKRAAQAGRWRVSEALLHGIDLVGGIGGGLLAQQMLRHKTAKPGFVLATATILGLHLAMLVLLVSGALGMPDIAKAFT